VSPTQRGRRAWETSVLLILAIVIVAALALNLAHLEPLGESTPLALPPASGRAADGSSLPDPILVAVLWSLALVVLVLIVFLILRHRKTIDRRPSSWRGLLVSVLAIVLIVILLASIPRSLSPSEDETRAADGTGAISVPEAPSLANGGGVEALLLLAVFGAIGWIVYRTRRGTGLPADGSVGPSAGMEVRRAATDAVRETIHELEIGGDVRTTILACFQRFCRLLGSRGLADQDAITAREIEALAVRTFAVSGDASACLTSLFEEARYSTHPLGEVEREQALESLSRIRAALEA
jgi:membrane protease YdiL (CAAX protease family)